MAERSVNLVILLGRLGKDAEQRFTQSGTAVCNFSMATSSRFKSGNEWQDKTEWHNVVLWNSENVSGYLLKGTKVHITGRLQTRSWEDKSGSTRYVTEIVATELILLGEGQGNSERGGEQPASRPAPAQRQASGRRQPPPARATEEDNSGYAVDDDVPF
jgi:single-strand DNA-binding protein